MYSIYKLTLPDGRAYIGMTGNKPYRRWCGGSNYADHPAFYHEIQYFGWKNITKEILEQVPDKETARERELYYIGLYKTYLPQYGFNVQGKSHFQEHKKKYKYVCAELGLEFDTLEQAGLFVGVCGAAISSAIIKGNKCGKKGTKYHFIKVKV